MRTDEPLDLLLAYDFPPMGGGISRWMDAMARHSPPQSLLVSTGSLPGAAAADAQLPQTVDRIATSSHRLRTVPGLRAWSSRAVTLADTHHPRFAWCDSIRPAGVPAWWLNRRRQVPYGIIMHGGDLLTLRDAMRRSPAKRAARRAILRNAAAFVANSQWTATLFAELLAEHELSSLRDRVHVVPLGTDPDRWNPTPDAMREFRARHHLPDGDWLVTVARLVPYKGIDDVIRAVAQLVPSRPRLRYVVVGRGDDLARLRALAEAEHVADRVHFLDDVSDAELAAAYGIGTVYVGLTRVTEEDVEGFGISFAEASASGLPVIATRTGGIPDAVRDGITGLLVAPGDALQSASAIEALLDDPARARTFGAAGKAHVEQHLNWQRVMRDMRRIAAAASESNRGDC